MIDSTDQTLLRQYSAERSESAFDELVRRHLDLVYSAALRMVRDPHLAQDVTQGVFMALARKASQLLDCKVLAGWLHRTTQNIAANIVRSDVRRRAREQEAALMNQSLSTRSEPEPLWESISPHLDAALGELGEADRDALMLRYFQRQSAREIAEILGISEEAAQKRLNRAVERLRELFARHGVTAGGGLVTIISTNAVQAAPAGLAHTISTAATVIAGTVAGSTATATATKGIVMTTLQKSLIAATLTIAVGTGLYEAREASTLRTQVQLALNSQAADSNQATAPGGKELTPQGGDPASQLAALREETETLRQNNVELLRLRAEVARLRAAEQKPAKLTASAQQTNDKMEALARIWASKANELKERIAAIPHENIPELQLLSDAEWLRYAEYIDPKKEDTYRSAFSQLREAAKKRFASHLGSALHKYAADNEGRIPSSLAELRPYLAPSIEDSTLQRYELRQTGMLSDASDREVIVEKAPVNADFDTVFKIGPKGFAYQGIGVNKGMSGSGDFGSVSYRLAPDR